MNRALLLIVTGIFLLSEHSYASEYDQIFTCSNETETFILLFNADKNVIFSKDGSDAKSSVSEKTATTLSYTWHAFQRPSNLPLLPDLLIFNHYLNSAEYTYNAISTFGGPKLPDDHLIANCEKAESSLNN